MEITSLILLLVFLGTLFALFGKFLLVYGARLLVDENLVSGKGGKIQEIKEADEERQIARHYFRLRVNQNIVKTPFFCWFYPVWLRGRTLLAAGTELCLTSICCCCVNYARGCYVGIPDRDCFEF